jgi:hypothetical protein
MGIQSDPMDHRYYWQLGDLSRCTSPLRDPVTLLRILLVQETRPPCHLLLRQQQGTSSGLGRPPETSDVPMRWMWRPLSRSRPEPEPEPGRPQDAEPAPTPRPFKGRPQD